MTEVSKKLKVNLRNIKRPIRGVLPKNITKDVVGIEIPLRVYSRIKYDCNVFYDEKDKEVVITNEQQFLQLLLKESKVSEKTVSFEETKIPVTIPADQESNTDIEPDVVETDKNLEETNTSVQPAEEEILKEADDTKLDEVTEYFNEVESTDVEQVEETPITTKDSNNTTVSRKNNKRNNRR